MCQIDEAQSESSKPENPLNNRFDFFSPTSRIPATLVPSLSDVHHALYGLCAISTILEASEVEKYDREGAPLNDILTAGLLAAMSTLAKFAQAELELLGMETGHE